MIPYRVITVENRSSCPNKEFHKAVWATSYQLIYQFGRSPWAETARGYLQLLSPGQKPPKGAAHLIVLDHSTEAGTLGFHEDEHNNEIPYADVFYKTSEEDGVAVSEVISHECLAGDTKIPLLDGTETTIKDMVGKKPQWVYSCNDQGEVKPGLAHSARITRHNAPVLKITLDNGESITCTSNHRFLLHNKTYLEASKLSVGQSLMPLYRDRKVIEPEKKRKGPVRGL